MNLAQLNGIEYKVMIKSSYQKVDTKATLILEDGTIFQGTSLGANGEAIGEVVFNTGMTGYQELLTDPSYYGQIVSMTYPLIGNYGINLEDVESNSPKIRGFIVREVCSAPSNWRSKYSIDNYLRMHNIVGLQGIDTRALTKILRDNGTMKGIITNDTNYLLESKINQINCYKIKNYIYDVTTKNIVHCKSNVPNLRTGHIPLKVAVLDFGVKANIVKSLINRNCDVTVFPAFESVENIINCDPDGILLSNGPGNPKDCGDIINNTIKKLIQSNIPIFGLCLGHQLLVLASGGNTKKLKYGHRGCNHPVKDCRTGLTYITSQNHGYCVEEESLKICEAEVSHRNMNDGTVEGIRYKNKAIISVQFHPEASPGPTDTSFLFDQFIQLMIHKSSNTDKGEII